MSTPTTAPSPPYDWIKTVESALVNHDDIPMLGRVEPFDWTLFGKSLAETFELESLAFEVGDWGWRSSDQLVEGLGQPLRFITVALSPLNGKAAILLPDDHLETAMSWLLKQPAGLFQLPDADYKDAFLRFFILEAMYLYQKGYPEKSLTPSLVSCDAPFQGDALCLDGTLAYNDARISFRIALSPELRASWQEHFTSGPLPATADRVAENSSVKLSVRCGNTTMTIPEWKQLNEGDLLVLTNCSVNPPPRSTNGGEPPTSSGRVTITLNESPLFVGEIEGDKVKISGYPVAVEEPPESGVEAMEPEEEEEEEDNGEFDEFEEDFDDDYEDEEQDDDDFLEDEEDDVEEELVEEEPTPSQPDEAERAPASAEPVAAASTAPAPVGPEDIPINIAVEVSRVQMNVKTLMELQPGNLLELDARPERGVNLVANGRTIAHGELVRVGDVLGVRILDLGK